MKQKGSLLEEMVGSDAGSSGLAGVCRGVHFVPCDSAIWCRCSTATKAAALIAKMSTISNDVMVNPQSISTAMTAGPIAARDLLHR